MTATSSNATTPGRFRERSTLPKIAFNSEQHTRWNEDQTRPETLD